MVVPGRDAAVPLQVDGEVGGLGLDPGQRGAQGSAEQLGEAETERAGASRVTRSLAPGGRTTVISRAPRTAGTSAGASRVVSQWPRPSAASADRRASASAYAA